MRTRLLPIITAITILLFAACSSDVILPDVNVDGNASDLLTITASIPGDGPTSRVGLNRQDNDFIVLAWQEGDKIEFAFLQDDITATSSVILSADNILADGQTANFSIPLPMGIDKGQEYTLYGVYGGDGLEENTTHVKLPTNPKGVNSSLIEVEGNKDVILYFKSEVKSGSIAIQFKHLGSLFSITLKNTGVAALENLAEVRLVGQDAANTNWAYNFEGGNIYDLESGFQESTSGANYISFRVAETTLVSGETTTLWGWYPPVAELKWPELKLELRDETSAIATSANSKDSRTEAFAAGKAFYFFAVLNDASLNFSLDAADSGHPFLIVTKDMFPELREKSSREPWKSMMEDAVSRSNKEIQTEIPWNLQLYTGSAALAYILDEENSQIHANRVYEAIKNQYPKISINNKDHGGTVPPAGALFGAILALDIVYDALTDEQVAECEQIIGAKVSQIDLNGSWVDARRGARGTWDIYMGKRTTPDNDYFEGIMSQITPDGVTTITHTYAWERIVGGNNTLAKSAYMDVLEFTGIDKRYYNNERLKKFMRWAFGSSVNPAKDYAIIGDMLPGNKAGNALLLRRVGNFDSEAAEYASWVLDGKDAVGHIITYILPKSALPNPRTPSSQIYSDGGAYLRDKEDNAKGLQLVLYNLKSAAGGHAHNEVNGLSLSGLGNRLLVNGGRLGASVEPAYLNNTLTITGKNHLTREGGGIVDSFTSDALDFAVGSSGKALFKSSHDRNALLVHTSNNVPGYFIFFDKVVTESGKRDVRNYFHPANETSVNTLSSKTEYTAPIDHFPSVNNVSVGFYYHTPPKEVNIEKVLGAAPSSYPNHPKHNRLEAVYDFDEDYSKKITTIVYPFSNSAPKPNFNKVVNSDFILSTMTNGGFTDYIVETMTENKITSEGMSIEADFCLVRNENSDMKFYFIKNGLSFLSNNVGFSSTARATVYESNNEGVIISDGATVKLTGPGIGSVSFTPSAKVISSGADYIEVELNKGTYKFK